MAPYQPPARRKLYRSRRSRRIAGVCGGLAEFFGVNPLLPRAVFVLLFLSGGSGVLIYLIAWLLMEDNPYQ